MAMTPETRKKLIIGIIIAMVLFGPLLLVSSPVMEYGEDCAVENASEEWAADLMLQCAEVYGYTLRAESELACYRRFYEKFENSPRRGYAKYMIAACMEKDHDLSKLHTVQAYEDFIEEFQSDEAFQTLPDWQFYLDEADRAIQRLAVN